MYHKSYIVSHAAIIVISRIRGHQEDEKVATINGGYPNLGKKDIKRLVFLPHERMKKRLVFFKTGDGEMLQFVVRVHEPKQEKGLHCARSGQS